MKKPTPIQKFHLSRLFLFLLLVVSILVAQNTSGTVGRLTYNKQAVLAYATNMNISELLSSVNQSRTANGLAQLSLNAKLNTSAQMKASDMIANNYWAHVSPSGVQPWYWFQQAGYAYASAGENLAYGFNTGSDVTIGWMNSPTHKDIILGDYVDVGFGIANSPSFQGGENTVVVAHFGKLQNAAPTPAPTTPTPAPTTPTPAPTTPTPAQTPIPATPPTTAPVPTTKSSPTPTKTTTAPMSPTPTKNSTPVTTTENTPAPPTTQSTNGTPTQPKSPQVAVQLTSNDRSVSILDEIRNGKATLAILVSIGLASATAAGFALTHRAFMKHLVQNGRKFVLHHPLLDVSGIVLTLGIILTTTVGHML